MACRRASISSSRRVAIALHVACLLYTSAAQWDALVGDWLPGSGYQPDQRPAMEFYLNDPDSDPEGRYHVEICLPVRSL